MSVDVNFKGDLLSLLKEYKLTRSVAIRNKIVTMNMGLVRQVTHRMSKFCVDSYEDLEQVGFLGLINAIERYDPTVTTAFSSFAVPTIRYEIMHFLRDKGGGAVRVPRKLQELHQTAQKVINRLTLELDQPPTDTAIAKALGVPLCRWEDCRMAMDRTKCVSLDVAIGQNLNVPIPLIDCLPDTADLAASSDAMDFDELSVAISALPERTQVAIHYVYFKEMPRKQAAKLMGVSPMTVTRHIIGGVSQLNELLGVECN